MATKAQLRRLPTLPAMRYTKLMFLLKRLILVLVLLALVVGGYLLLSAKQPVRAEIPFLDKTLSLSPTNLGPLSETTSQQLSTLAKRSGAVGDQVEQVLGTAIQATEEGEAIHNKAFDYGRYLYCQQVVKEYEQNQPTP